MSDAQRQAFITSCSGESVCVWYSRPLRKVLAAGITASALATSSAAAHASLESFVAVEQVPEASDPAAMEAWEETTRAARDRVAEEVDASSVMGRRVKRTNFATSSAVGGVHGGVAAEWCDEPEACDLESSMLIVVGGTVATDDVRWADESGLQPQTVLPEIEAGDWLPTPADPEPKP